jgi:AraC-like DNA-binding protein
MSFQQRAPDPRLESFIAAYWRLDDLKTGQLYAATPKRHLELVVNFGAPQLAGNAQLEQSHEYRVSWLTGLRDKPLFLKPTGQSVLYGVVFRDFALPDWTLNEAERSASWSTDLCGSPTSTALVEALAGSNTLEEAARKLDGFFLRSAWKGGWSSELGAAVSACEKAGQLSPSRIIASVGLHPASARALAQSICGTSLRRYVRLVRFDRALRLMSDEPRYRIADIAHEAGYYDEAHMAHDFAALTGTSPGRLRNARLKCSSLPHHLFTQ